MEVPAQSPPPVPARRPLTRSDCELLESSGVSRDHFELVEGELISKMGKKRPHANTLTMLHEWLVNAFGFRRVQLEVPIDVAPDENSINEPEPDAIVLSLEASSYASNPKPKDLRLVVEISDSTLLFDLGTKARLYARAGISEYWVIDVQGRRVVVHRGPRAGTFDSVLAYSEIEKMSPLAAPDASFKVADVLPPATL